MKTLKHFVALLSALCMTAAMAADIGARVTLRLPRFGATIAPAPTALPAAPTKQEIECPAECSARPFLVHMVSPIEFKELRGRAFAHSCRQRDTPQLAVTRDIVRPVVVFGESQAPHKTAESLHWDLLSDTVNHDDGLFGCHVLIVPVPSDMFR